MVKIHAVPVAVVLASLSLHCGNDADRAVDRGSTVIIAHPGFGGRGFTPDLVLSERDLVFLPLMRINESGELEGALAESWEYFPDTEDVIYHLRNDAQWHDGVPVTAHDVKFSMELMTHPDVLLEGPGMFEEVEVIDDKTLRARKHGGGVDEVSWPKHLLEDLEPAEFYDWDFWQQPVGNGPYRFSRYQPNSFLELEANPNYFDGRPRIERLVLKFVGDAGVRELAAGEVDAVPNARPPDALSLKNDPRFGIYHSYNGWWVQEVIYWRHDTPFFEDANVRRALTLAIDRRALLRLQQIPESIPIVDAPYYLQQLARNEFPEPLPYDPTRAKSLLESAGWIDTDGDGIRERQGVKFSFTAAVNQAHSNNSVMAVFIQEQLRKVGIEMGILMTERAVIREKLEGGAIEAAIDSGGFSPNLIRRLTGYEDLELTRIREANHDDYQGDPAKKSAGYRRAHEIFVRDVPVTFLGPRIQVSIVHKRIQGLSTPWLADPIWHLDRLWIREDEAP